MAVRLERHDQVGVVTLSRPEAFNAFNSEQLTELRNVAHEIASDGEIRAVVLTGEGRRAFASGADIKEMAEKGPSDGLAFAHLGQEITTLIEACPQPWIAAINGYALGGGAEIALACDIRLASDNAVIGQPEVTLGIMPGWGATQRLTQLVGRGIASELILTGRRLSANEALALGIVNAVHPLDDLVEKAIDLARTIANGPPLAIAASKRAILAAANLSLANGLEHEALAFGMLFGTEDQREGMRAFLDKRSATFSGT